MRRRSTPIPWDATTAGALTRAERARLAGTWMRRSEAEYLAVSTFSVLAIDLVAAQAPADVISLCLRAGIDEVRHAEMCVRMAKIYSGEENLPVPGMSALPDDPSRPKLHQALANTMLVSCVSETYATTVLSATRDLTTDPTAQAVLTSIYSDEVMHARLGWSYLRHAIEIGGQGVIDAAAEMLPRRAARRRERRRARAPRGRGHRGGARARPDDAGRGARDLLDVRPRGAGAWLCRRSAFPSAARSKTMVTHGHTQLTSSRSHCSPRVRRRSPRRAAGGGEARRRCSERVAC